MSNFISVSHTISINLPLNVCQSLFTPAGEELWVAGWQPRYLEPPDGRTTQGMTFVTGDADEHTVWMLVRYQQQPHLARYLRVTPASRWGYVEVTCLAESSELTHVTVSYAMHALNAKGERALADFEPERFTVTIDGWKREIENRLQTLRLAQIR